MVIYRLYVDYLYIYIYSSDLIGICERNLQLWIWQLRYGNYVMDMNSRFMVLFTVFYLESYPIYSIDFFCLENTTIYHP